MLAKIGRIMLVIMVAAGVAMREIAVCYMSHVDDPQKSMARTTLRIRKQDLGRLHPWIT